jgi:hypothetical protein
MAFAADTHPTLVDIAKVNAADDVSGLLDETIQDHPEIDAVTARTIKGVHYKSLVRTTLPTVGFRDANEGYAASKGVYENRLFESFIFNPRWECDKAIADRSEDGAEQFIAMEAGAVLEASLQCLSEQFFYGRGTAASAATIALGDAKGFWGLLELSEALGVSLAARLAVTINGMCTDLVVDAGGTTADTGSSVWMVKSDPQHVSWIWGNNGNLDVDPVKEERVLDANSLPFTAYTQELLAYPGLQVKSHFSFGRIGELTEQAGFGLTDALLAELWAKFPTAFKPNLIFMSRRSQRQLRDSRLTATGMTIMASGQPVPFPDNWMGVPIKVTDAISDAEEIGILTA